MKRFIKSHPIIINVIAFIYNMFFSRCRIALLTGKIKAEGAFLKGTTAFVRGKNSLANIERMTHLKKCKIYINGANCELRVGGGRTIVSNTCFYCEDDNSSIVIGKDFTMGSGHIAATEGEIVKIGDDCMFSNDVEIRNGDSHAIIDRETRKRLNNARSVLIGDHVWITAHVRVMKGCTIADGSIIANSCIATGNLETPNSIYGGNPIHMLKERVEWSRYRNL